MFSRNPELSITDAEAEELANAFLDLQKHYNIDVDPKAQAWIELIMVAAFVYTPRAVMIRKRRAEERVKAQADSAPKDFPQSRASAQEDAPRKPANPPRNGPEVPSQIFGAVESGVSERSG